MHPTSILLPGIALLAPALFSACRKAPEPEPIVIVRKELPESVLRNNLASLPGSVHALGADSPIHWQPWTRDTLLYAQAAERMIFAFITMPQSVGFAEALKALDADPRLVEIINTSYMPVLIDGDAAREITLLTADLAIEIEQDVNLPFFLWMSPQANPVAFIPAPWSNAEKIRDQFRASHALVSEIWTASPQYVIENSALDNQPRRERINRRRLSNIQSANPVLDTTRAIRQLNSLYDPFTRTMHEVGGLFPYGVIDLLAAAAMQPDLPESERDRSRETLDALLDDLLGSPMFDPLDGGVFIARRAGSWKLPLFQRHSIAQSRAAAALFRAHQATGSPLALERALALLEFATANYQTSDGLYAVGLSPSTEPHNWLWNVAEIEQILGTEEAAWWTRFTGMDPLGNLPYEIDPSRRFFRRNVLSTQQTAAGFAAGIDIPPSVFERRLKSARERLLAAREARIGKNPPDESSHAGASFRMVSAFAAAYAATGDDAWRDKAVALLNLCRRTFSDGARLRLFPGEAPDSINAARAFIYALAIQSILDVIDITGDATWFDWCDDLATVMTETFTDGNFLREASAEASIIDLPATDLLMLFDDSSVGLLNFAECRLAAHGRPLVRDLVNISGSLPTSAVRFPVQHTDLLVSFLSRTRPVTIVWNDSTSPELLSAIRRLPPRMFHRRAASPSDILPSGGARVVRGDLADIPVSTPGELANALLPQAVRK